VRNDVVRYKPRPLKPGEADPVSTMLPATHPCRVDRATRRWTCVLQMRES
jgi:hypothetical protein